MKCAILLLSAAAITNACAQNSEIQPQFDTKFIQIPESTSQWLGFINDGKELFFGGCAPLSIADMTIATQCRWPDNIRWSIGSQPQDVVLFTTQDRNKFHSYIAETRSGRLVSHKEGIYFAQPGALHPTRNIWATSIAISPDGGESIAIYDFSFKRSKRPKDVSMSRVYSLAFSRDGKNLFAAAPTYTVALDTTLWKESSASNESTLWPDDGNQDATLAVVRKAGHTEIVETSTKMPIISVNIDSLNEAYPVAFSLDGRWIAIRGIEQNSTEEPRYGVLLIRRHDNMPFHKSE